VYEGMMTSSPGSISARIAAISSAAVHEWVSSALPPPARFSSHDWHCRVKGPSPARWPLAWAWAMYPSSLPTMCGRLKGISVVKAIHPRSVTKRSREAICVPVQATCASSSTGDIQAPQPSHDPICWRTTYGGRSIVRRCIRARYSPMMPSASNCAPENMAMIDARKTNP